MAVGSVNVGGGGGRLNIYTQLSEPSKKEGLWIETATRHKAVMVDDKFYFDNAWIDRSLGLYPDIPYDFSNGSAVKVGTDIYLIGGNSSSPLFYRYDTITKVYTQLSNLPMIFINGSAAAVGSNIYLFGGNYGSGDSYKGYKYDITSGTFTQLSNIPYSHIYGSSVAIGTNIYLFGGGVGDPKKAYKYDTVNGTYTKLADIPVSHTASVAVAVGNDVYLISDNNSISSTYKYNTITNTYTKLVDFPVGVGTGGVAAFGSEIYVFVTTRMYKYDILNNTYTRLADVPNNFTKGVVVGSGDKIYLLGGQHTTKYVQVFSLTSKQYADETLVLFRNSSSSGAYYTEFITPRLGLRGAKDTRILSGFNDAWLFTSGKLQELPSYYGNGSQWVKFKN